jgi:hypothetical protein
MAEASDTPASTSATNVQAKTPHERWLREWLRQRQFFRPTADISAFQAIRY